MIRHSHCDALWLVDFGFNTALIRDCLHQFASSLWFSIVETSGPGHPDIVH